MVGGEKHLIMAFQIETKRLLIRKPDDQDLVHFRKWLSDPELARFVGGVRSEEHILRTFQHISKNWQEWGFGTAMLIWKDSGDVVGSCGINKIEVEGQTEYDLGYLIIQNYWGMGLATESAQAILDYAVKTLKINRVTAWPSQNNKPSVRVAEKLGFKFEKTISKTHAGAILNDMSLYIWRNG